MNNSQEKTTGIALLVFVILLVFTMLLHPAGGSIEHLTRITKVIIITHAIAIFSLPFGWIGFWGLTKKLGTDRFGPVLGFAFISLGLVAVLMAAATNGIVMPLLLQQFKGGDVETIRPVLRYSFAVNHAFDYIYTGAFCTAILLWSVAIISTKKLAAWVGWLGIAIVIGAVIVFSAGVAVNDLRGFRIFVIGIVVWVLCAGTQFISKPSQPGERSH